jgi:hypothetical protein
MLQESLVEPCASHSQKTLLLVSARFSEWSKCTDSTVSIISLRLANILALLSDVKHATMHGKGVCKHCICEI